MSRIAFQMTSDQYYLLFDRNTAENKQLFALQFRILAGLQSIHSGLLTSVMFIK